METIELTTTVLSGGRIEIADPRLKEGQGMAVVLHPISPTNERPSIAELLRRPMRPEERCFSSVEDLEAAIEEERNAWD